MDNSTVIWVVVDRCKSIMGVEMKEQLILPMEKIMNGRPLLSLLTKDEHSTGEQKCKGHFGQKEEYGSSRHGVYSRKQLTVPRKESCGWGRMSH